MGRRLELSAACTLHDLKIYLRSILMANYVRWWQSFSCSSLLLLLLLFCHPVNFRVHEWKVVSCKHVSEKRFSFSHFYLQQQNESSGELSWKKIKCLARFAGFDSTLLLASVTPHFLYSIVYEILLSSYFRCDEMDLCNLTTRKMLTYCSVPGDPENQTLFKAGCQCEIQCERL